MRGLFLMLKGITLALAGGWAQVSTPVLPTHPNENSLLWEVSGNGLEKPSYFLGTMHILCPEDAWLSPSVTRILDHVNGVYLEMDLSNLAQMMGAMKAMVMRNDTTLADLLSEEELAAVKAYFAERLPLPFTLLSRFKPMMLSGMMAEQMLPCRAGSGTETLLMAEAKKRKLKMDGLETVAQQAGFFDSIPYRLQAEELLKALHQEGEQTDVVEKMLTAFQQQDLPALESITVSEEGGMAGFLEILLYNRNENWVKQFKGISQKGSYLFAVGAGHLPGERGVLNLLRSQGYQLRPVSNTKPDQPAIGNEL